MKELDPLNFVRFFAATKHATQMYGGGLPYTHHLAAVEGVLRRFGRTDLHLLKAAWLHDVVEDFKYTQTKLKDVEEMFGDKVAALVSAVTNEEGANRKIRHALTYPKTRAGGVEAITLKLADRIANVEAGGNLVGMYKKEYDDFRRALYTPGENEDMWNHLNGLLS
jgi:(p)ppGpp synthase/HD superfamily hydrolase